MSSVEGRTSFFMGNNVQYKGIPFFPVPGIVICPFDQGEVIDLSSLSSRYVSPGARNPIYSLMFMKVTQQRRCFMIFRPSSVHLVVFVCT